MLRLLVLPLCLLLGALAVDPASAELTSIRVGRTPTLSQLPIYVLEAEKLLEKNARAAGLGDVTVSYVDVAGGAVLNDMLLSGNLEFATGGVPPFLILWSRALGSPSEVRAIAAVGGTPSTLYTRNPNVHSIRDLTPADKIAVAGVKSSQVAILLQMAAAQVFGEKNYDRLDALTVTLRDADAVGIMKSGKGELTGHFTYDPYRAAYEGDAGIRPILQSREVFGDVGTVALAYATTQLRNANPRLVAAYLAALKEADEMIRARPRPRRPRVQATHQGGPKRSRTRADDSPAGRAVCRHAGGDSEGRRVHEQHRHDQDRTRDLARRVLSRSAYAAGKLTRAFDSHWLFVFLLHGNQRSADSRGSSIALFSAHDRSTRGHCQEITMPTKYGPKAQEKVEKVMKERKRGTLRSGSTGKKVTSRKQAIAIGLSEARRAGAKVPDQNK